MILGDIRKVIKENKEADISLIVEKLKLSVSEVKAALDLLEQTGKIEQVKAECSSGSSCSGCNCMPQYISYKLK